MISAIKIPRREVFPQMDEILYVLFQCLVHARQDDLSGSPIWHVLYHSPDRACNCRCLFIFKAAAYPQYSLGEVGTSASAIFPRQVPSSVTQDSTGDVLESDGDAQPGDFEPSGEFAPFVVYRT